MHFSVAVIVLAGVFVAPTLSAPAVVVQDDRFMASQAAFSPSSPIIQLPAVSGASSQSALVSTQINNQRTNQSFAVGDGPIVAVLPAGSNLSATWDLSSNAQPTIGLASFVSSTLASVVALVDLDSFSTMSTSTETSSSSTETNFNPSLMNIPVILPVGVAVNANQNAFISQSMVPNLQAGPQIGGLAGSNRSLIGPVNADGMIAQQNHRIEIQLIDFQMNNSANNDINQNMAIFLKFSTVVVGQAIGDLRTFNLADATPVQVRQSSAVVIPQTTSGMQQIFDGTYRTSAINKVAVSRTLTQDLCGQMNDRAVMNVVIAPLTAADGVNFQQQSYSCVVNLMFPTAARISESFWSDTLQCNSGDVNGLSFRLWYRIRQYNINSQSCQQNALNPVAIS